MAATIDLRIDAPDVQKMLADAVRAYAARSKGAATAAKHPPVTRIDLVFSLADGDEPPWIHLHFDTKPGSEPDGDPTHPDFARITRRGWLPAVQAVCDGEKTAVATLQGKIRKCSDAQLGETIGSFLVDVLLTARDSGVFADLPKGKRCELGVEDPTTGDFGWPDYDERGKKNLVK